MHHSKALQQLADIHFQLARASVFRGYRPIPLALIGGVAFLAALIQPRFDPSRNEGVGFVVFWTLVATLAVSFAAVGILRDYLRAWRGGDATSRRRIEAAGVQLLPGLIVGAVVTVLVVFLNRAHIPLLPGLWALFFGLSIYASRSCVPRPMVGVALFYLICGAVLLARGLTGAIPSPWWVGFPFCIGHLSAAGIQYVCVERKRHDTQ